MSREWTTLVQARPLADALGHADLAIVDCRFSLAAAEAGPAAFEQAHVPGAVYAHLDRDLSGVAAPGSGAGRHPWPDADAFCARLGAWGISSRHQVVAYDAGDGAFAARLWFALQALGHRRVAVLDGGWTHWQALGLPVESVARAPAPVRYQGRFDASRLLDAAGVQALLDTGGLLMDARAGERFRGQAEPIDRVAGHVPGADNRPYADNLQADGRFLPPQALREAFLGLLAGRDPTRAAMMCGSGVTACHHLLAMAHAGLPGAKLYTGSWSGWIENPGRHVATGPA